MNTITNKFSVKTSNGNCTPINNILIGRYKNAEQGDYVILKNSTDANANQQFNSLFDMDNLKEVSREDFDFITVATFYLAKKCPKQSWFNAANKEGNYLLSSRELCMFTKYLKQCVKLHSPEKKVRQVAVATR